ncbi:MAG: glycosyltransferase family 1 protein [Acidimicrobiia bacterium]|nr:glycosyltransferase family 1 protein [Acidimicrobiia bacterium]
MRVLGACSLGGAGHLNPIVPLLEAAARAGHEVLVIAPPAMAEMVREAGFVYEAGGEPAESEVAPIRERLPVVAAAEALVLGNRELFGRLAATAMLPAMERVCAEWMPHLVLRDPCEYASAVVAHGRGIRTAQVGISLAEGEHASIFAAAPALEEHRTGLVEELLASPYVTRFPESLDPSPFRVSVRYHEQPPPPKPLPDWWDGDDAPLIYLTFGTVLGHMTIAAQVYGTAIAAVAELDVRVLLTVGRKFDASELGTLPAKVHVEWWIDQSDAFAEADVVVCHGGSGTSFGALAAGVPVVVAPVFADQFENGRRIVLAGVGATTAGTDDGPGIAKAINTVLDDHSFRRAAQAVAAEMASTHTTDDVITTLM